jgi:mannan endo-1,6-alpha-mannosidase
MFMTLIQYWHWTGDTSYNEVTTQGMLWQRGKDDFFPKNDSSFLGNDDQVFWGLAAMTAAELNFPEGEGDPSWLSLAQGVFNTQVPRWDTQTCGGGLRWQIFPYQAGYTMKNAISNGGLFQLAARLGRYTKNETYIQWAEKIWDWSATTPLLNVVDWTIADSTGSGADCKDHGDTQWSYNYGTYLSGAAYMYNLVSFPWHSPLVNKANHHRPTDARNGRLPSTTTLQQRSGHSSPRTSAAKSCPRPPASRG